MVTLPLERMASRVAASLCYATGLGHEMVVNSQQVSLMQCVALCALHVACHICFSFHSLYSQLRVHILKFFASLPTECSMAVLVPCDCLMRQPPGSNLKH